MVHQIVWTHYVFLGLSIYSNTNTTNTNNSRTHKLIVHDSLSTISTHQICPHDFRVILKLLFHNY